MTQILLNDRLAERLEQVATTQGVTLVEFLEQVADRYFPHTVEESIPQETVKEEATWQGQQAQINYEQDAYQTQYPLLLQKYANQYIAMHKGKVVAHDSDRVRLSRHIRQCYGNQPIFMTQVHSEPIQTIYLRSPRLVLNE